MFEGQKQEDCSLTLSDMGVHSKAEFTFVASPPPLVACGLRRCLDVWDICARKCLCTIRSDDEVTGEYATLAYHVFSPDGLRCFAAFDGCLAQLWSFELNRRLLTFGLYVDEDDILRVAFAPNGHQIVTAKAGSMHTRIQAFPTETQTCNNDVSAVWTFEAGHNTDAVSFSSDNCKVVLLGAQVVNILSADTGASLHSLATEGAVISAVELPGHEMFVEYDDGTARVWSSSPGGCKHSFGGSGDHAFFLLTSRRCWLSAALMRQRFGVQPQES